MESSVATGAGRICNLQETCTGRVAGRNFANKYPQSSLRSLQSSSPWTWGFFLRSGWCWSSEVISGFLRVYRLQY